MGGSDQGTSPLVADNVAGTGKSHCQPCPTLSSCLTYPPLPTLFLPYLILGENNRRKRNEKELVRKKNEKVEEKQRLKHKGRLKQQNGRRKELKKREKDQEWRRREMGKIG